MGWEEEEWTSEHELLLAVLERAVLDYQGIAGFGDCRELNAKERASLERFIFADIVDENNICATAYSILNFLGGDKATYFLKRIRTEIDKTRMFVDENGVKRTRTRKANRMKQL